MTTDPRRLLPPNSTELELNLTGAFPRDALGALADVPRNLKSARPAAVLPWLASEWWLSGFVPYFPDLASLIEAGLPWLMERGAPAAIRRALDWIGLDVAAIEEDESLLQMDPGKVPTMQELADLVYLTLASIPAHVDLYRLYHGYDLRPVGWSQPAALDDGLWSDDSGVWMNINGEDVKLSFGHTRAGRILVPGLALSGGRFALWWGETFYEDRFRWDVSAYDSEIVVDHPVMRTGIFVSGNRGLDRPVSRCIAEITAKSALAWSDEESVWSDQNCGFEGGMEIEESPLSWSDAAKWSDYDNGAHWFYVDERRERMLAARLALPAPAFAAVARAACLANIIRRADRDNHWRGGWDDKPWRDRGNAFGVNITHE